MRKTSSMSETENPTAVELKSVAIGEDVDTKEEDTERASEYHKDDPKDVLKMTKKKAVPKSDLLVLSSNDKKSTMTSKELAMSKIKLNLARLFHHWDIDRNDYVDLRELQLGLYGAGELVPRETLLYHIKRVSGRKNHDNKCYARDFPDLIIALSDGTIENLQKLTIQLSKNLPLKTKNRPSLWLRMKGTFKKKRKSSAADSESGTQSPKTRSQSTLDSIVSSSQSIFGNGNIHFYQPKVMWEMLTFQRGVTPAFLMFLLWQFGFSLFYTLYNGFQFDRAFYYSAQAGLSVGFGALSEEYKSGFSENEDCTATKHFSKEHFDFSKFVTIINILLGSSVIGGALGFFIDSALEKQSAWFEQEEKKKKHDAKKAALLARHESAGLAKLAIVDFYDNNRTEILLTTGVLLFIVAGILYGTLMLDLIFLSLSLSLFLYTYTDTRIPS